MSITISKKIKPIEYRKIIKASNFHFNIPLNWVRYFKMQKGQLVMLKIDENGFFVKIIDEKEEKESIESDSPDQEDYDSIRIPKIKEAT